MKKIMIIAGGEWQIPLIKKAKKLGLFVINSNLYENSPGFEFADIGVVADVLNKEKNLEFALQYRPDAVVTDQSDIAIPTVAYLCEQLHLPGIGEEKATLFTNKYEMRKFCRDHGFLFPEFRLCTSVEDVKSLTSNTGYPVVIKPPASQASRGVYKIESPLQVEEKFRDTLSYSRDGTVLAEQFIGGIELTVEGFKVKKKHYSLAISEKEHFSHNEMVASRLLYSHTNDRIDYECLREINNSLVEKMGLPFGITHAEYKYWNGEFYLVEIAARGGGTNISSHIVPLMSGIDTNDLLLRIALGEKIEDIAPVRNNIFLMLDFLTFPSGKLISINGMESLANDERIVAYGLNYKIGDVVSPPSDDRSRHGFFIAYERTRESLESLTEHIKQTVRGETA